MNNKTRSIVYLSMYCAFAIVLDYVNQFIPFLQMPYGGSINLSVIPLMVASYHFGWGKGAFCGLVYWLIGLTLGLNNYIVTPLQTILDYVLPAVIVGMPALFPKICKVNNVIVGVSGVMLIKYLSHVIAGAYYWFPEGEAAGSGVAWVFSLNYNVWYNLVTMIIAIIVVPIIIRRLNSSTKFKFNYVKK